MTGFAPPRIAFEFHGSIGHLFDNPPGWVVPAGRQVWARGYRVNAYGPTEFLVGLGLDTAYAAAGAGIVVLATPAFLLEPGHVYQVSGRYWDSTNAGPTDWRYRSTTIRSGVPATHQSLNFNMTGESPAQWAPLEILSTGALSFNPMFFDLVVTRTSP